MRGGHGRGIFPRIPRSGGGSIASVYDVGSGTMSSHRDRRQSSLTIGQKIPMAGYGRFWEVKQAIGKNAKGEMQYLEAFVDMSSGKDGGEKDVYLPENGWNGEPPPLPSGDPGRQACYMPPNSLYRRNYGRIDWKS